MSEFWDNVHRTAERAKKLPAWKRDAGATMANRPYRNRTDDPDAPVMEWLDAEESSKIGSKMWRRKKQRTQTLKKMIAANSKLSAWFRMHADNQFLATTVCNHLEISLQAITKHVMGVRPLSLLKCYKISRYTEISMEKLVEEHLWAVRMRGENKAGVQLDEIKKAKRIVPPGWEDK